MVVSTSACTQHAARSRLLSALAGRLAPSRMLWIPTVGVTFETMAAAGAYWPEAHRDAALMARLARATFALSGCPCCTLPFCLTVEAEALGAGVHLGARDRHPQVVRPVTIPPAELAVPADFLERGRIPIVLDAIARLATAGEEQPVNAKIAGPFTVACNLYGPHDFLRWTIKRPQAVARVLNVVADACLALANAAIACGADIVTVADPTASASLISRAMYERFVFPAQQRLFAGIAAPKVLHMCGNTTSHLPLIAALPIDGFSFEDLVSVAEAKRVLGTKIAAIGNLPPVALLEHGSPDAVRAATKKCLAEGIDIVASGCALPLSTPLANLRAMVEAVAEAAGAGSEKCT